MIGQTDLQLIMFLPVAGSRPSENFSVSRGLYGKVDVLECYLLFRQRVSCWIARDFVTTSSKLFNLEANLFYSKTLVKKSKSPSKSSQNTSVLAENSTGQI